MNKHLKWTHQVLLRRALFDCGYQKSPLEESYDLIWLCSDFHLTLCWLNRLLTILRINSRISYVPWKIKYLCVASYMRAYMQNYVQMYSEYWKINKPSTHFCCNYYYKKQWGEERSKGSAIQILNQPTGYGIAGGQSGPPLQRATKLFVPLAEPYEPKIQLFLTRLVGLSPKFLNRSHNCLTQTQSITTQLCMRRGQPLTTIFIVTHISFIIYCSDFCHTTCLSFLLPVIHSGVTQSKVTSHLRSWRPMRNPGCLTFWLIEKGRKDRKENWNICDGEVFLIKTILYCPTNTRCFWDQQTDAELFPYIKKDILFTRNWEFCWKGE
jgi:hypothetical protein